jgi:acetyl esterase
MRRLVTWLLLAAVVLAVTVVAAFRFSPWPSVAIIAHAFSRGGQTSEAALVKHVPPGIVTRRNLSYGAGKDEVFDVNYPEGTRGPLPTIVWVHGGGSIAGSKDHVANYLKILAAPGYTTIGVEYSTGFGSSYPKPVEQVNAALGYITANAAELNVDPEIIVLAGDSAGAQIAAQIAIITTNASYAQRIGIAPKLRPQQLAAVLLLSGAYGSRGYRSGRQIRMVPENGALGLFGIEKLPERRTVCTRVGDKSRHSCFPAQLHFQRQRRSACAAGGCAGAEAEDADRQGRHPVLFG